MILITGGTGYIGSHTAVALLDAGQKIVLYDNLKNSSMEVVSRIENISQQRVPFEKGDVRDPEKLSAVLQKYSCKSVIHFAALKAAGESAAKAGAYYSVNLVGTAQLLAAMEKSGTRRILFSSSATVYGKPLKLPYEETHPLNPVTPYGRTKLASEWMINDWGRSNSEWKIGNLRYFNPAGAHPSGNLGEKPKGAPCNLVPFVSQVAAGLIPRLQIWGADYPTHDGTGVRDYIHVMDLAKAHVIALNKLEKNPGFTVNIGVGRGYSVMEVVNTFESITGKPLAYEIGPRREGDLAEYFASAALAKRLLGWEAKKSLNEICADQWRWQCSQHFSEDFKRTLHN